MPPRPNPKDAPPARPSYAAATSPAKPVATVEAPVAPDEAYQSKNKIVLRTKRSALQNLRAKSQPDLESSQQSSYQPSPLSNQITPDPTERSASRANRPSDATTKSRQVLTLPPEDELPRPYNVDTFAFFRDPAIPSESLEEYVSAAVAHKCDATDAQVYFKFLWRITQPDDAQPEGGHETENSEESGLPKCAWCGETSHTADDCAALNSKVKAFKEEKAWKNTDRTIPLEPQGPPAPLTAHGRVFRNPQLKESIAAYVENAIKNKCSGEEARIYYNRFNRIEEHEDSSKEAVPGPNRRARSKLRCEWCAVKEHTKESCPHLGRTRLLCDYCGPCGHTTEKHLEHWPKRAAGFPSNEDVVCPTTGIVRPYSVLTGQVFRDPNYDLREDADEYVADAEYAGCFSRETAWLYYWHIKTTQWPAERPQLTRADLKDRINKAVGRTLSTPPPSPPLPNQPNRPRSPVMDTMFREPNVARETAEHYADNAVRHGCDRQNAWQYYWHFFATDKNGPMLRSPVPSVESLKTWLSYAEKVGLPKAAALAWYENSQASPPAMQAESDTSAPWPRPHEKQAFDFITPPKYISHYPPQGFPILRPESPGHLRTPDPHMESLETYKAYAVRQSSSGKKAEKVYNDAKRPMFFEPPQDSFELIDQTEQLRKAGLRAASDDAKRLGPGLRPPPGLEPPSLQGLGNPSSPKPPTGDSRKSGSSSSRPERGVSKKGSRYAFAKPGNEES